MAVPFPCVVERLGHFVAERRDVADVTPEYTRGEKGNGRELPRSRFSDARALLGFHYLEKHVFLGMG
jgi:hypothetical protein